MPRGRRPAWTEETIVAAIRDFYARVGRWPVTLDCRAAQGLPTFNTISLVCGSLLRANCLAGMSPTKPEKRGAAFERSWAGTHSREDGPE